MKQRFLYLASRQGMLSQRIAKNVNLYAQVGTEAELAASEFQQDAKRFRETEAELRPGVPASVKPKLEEVTQTFEEVNGHIEALLAISDQLFVSQRASQTVYEQSNVLLDKANQLVAAYTKMGEVRVATRTFAGIAGIFSGGVLSVR